MLSDAQITQWQQDGFLVLPNFKSPQAVAALRERSLAIVDALVVDGALPVFSTRDGRRNKAIDYCCLRRR